VSLPPPPSPSAPAIPPPPQAESIEEPRPSRIPLIVGSLLVLTLFGGAALIWSWVNRPSPCSDANVISDRFGYCISAPSGWRFAGSSSEQSSADQLFRPDDDTTLTIQAIETRRDLRAFADDVRRLQADNHLDTGAYRSLVVAGVDALEWDATLRSSSGAILSRTVIFERDGVAWRVEFADTAGAFDVHVGDLARMLGSWRFR
jgi:hypothetical protein